MNALVELAKSVGVNERTLRRAVNDGIIRADRPSPRSIRLSIAERQFVRRAWPTIAPLRQALRTEPNVRFAMLFGSIATGRATSTSDIDLIVDLHDATLETLADLTVRLGTAVARPVDLTRFADAESDPAFLAAAISEGRVLVDRDDRWPSLQRRQPALLRRAAADLTDRRDAALHGIDQLLARDR